MKRVVVITRLYHHANVRVERLTNYLPEFGWEPLILMPPLSVKPNFRCKVIETPYRDVLGFWKRLFRFNPDEDITRQLKRRFGVTSRKSFIDFVLIFFREVFCYPDGEKGWKPFALKAGGELLQNQNITAIISSAPPVTSHLIAKELKARYKIPWIADIRDLWSQNHYYPYGPVRRLLDRRLELKTLSQADALVTVSQPWAEKLGALHRGKSVYTITHGFDPEEINMLPADLAAKFTITYTGSIYPGKQDPSKLFVALSNLISAQIIDPNRVKIRFYGPREGWLEREVEEYSLSGIIRQYGRVPRQVALEKQWESQLLLFLNWEDPQERGLYTGKIFEYLAARRPILATGGSGNDVVKELLDETKAGMYAPTVEDIKNMLKELYREYELKGKITYKGKEPEISKHSYREVARKFSEILNSLI